MQEPDEAYILKIGLEIMCRESNGGAVETADRRFREVFGCGVAVVLMIWQMLDPESTASAATSVSHMLWALMFLKVYAKESTLSAMAGGVDEKTFRRWAWAFVRAIASLEPYTVSNKS